MKRIFNCTVQVQPKCCRKISIPISALSLHVRQHDEERTETNNEGPFNELKVVGGFTVAEVNTFHPNDFNRIQSIHFRFSDARLDIFGSAGCTRKTPFRGGRSFFDLHFVLYWNSPEMQIQVSLELNEY